VSHSAAAEDDEVDDTDEDNDFVLLLPGDSLELIAWACDCRERISSS
jgi:hypothetical protein